MLLGAAAIVKTRLENDLEELPRGVCRPAGVVPKHGQLRRVCTLTLSGTKPGQSGAVSGGRGLPPDHKSPNESGPERLK